MTQSATISRLWGARAAVPHKAPMAHRLAALLQSRWLWCVAVVSFLVLRDIAGGNTELLKAFGDTDDATRLVQVREFLAGAGWFDLVMARFGGATPLVSHWSRLIDAPLALLLMGFGMVLSPEHAETAMRAVWPSLMFVVLLRVLMHESEQRAGAAAAALVLAFAATAVTGIFQFRLGRIDHHNVMIVGTLAGLLLAARAFENPKLGYTAGAAAGFALVIGFEPLALLLPLMGLAVLVAAIWPTHLLAVRNLAIGLAGTLAAGLVVAVPPHLWSLSVCDALSLNLVMLAGVGALGCAGLEAYGRGLHRAWRVAAVGLMGLVGGALYLAANPVCIGGPFAEVSLDARQLWLAQVIEGQPITTFMTLNPAAGWVMLVFCAAGITAALERSRRLGSAEAAVMAVIMVLSVVPALIQIKFVAYASFMAAVCIAVSLAAVVGNAQLTPLSVRLAGLLALNQWTISLLVSAVLIMAGTPKALVEGKSVADKDKCSEFAAVRPLGALPKGFIVTHIDLGPAIVALTHHDVLAAPYHRIDAAIVETQKIFRATPEVAERRLRQINATYVVECISAPVVGRDPGLSEGVSRQSLLGRLTFGEPVAFLTEIPQASPEPALRVWRVIP